MCQRHGSEVQREAEKHLQGPLENLVHPGDLESLDRPAMRRESDQIKLLQCVCQNNQFWRIAPCDVIRLTHNDGMSFLSEESSKAFDPL